MTQLELGLHDNANVVVVGASGAIGRAFIDLLVEHEGVASIHALSRAPIELAHPKVHRGPIDLEREATIEAAAGLAAADAPIDMVIVATGLLHDGPDFQPEKSARHLDSDRLVRSFAVNAAGPALVGKHFLPKLRRDHRAIFAALSARVGSVSDNRVGGWYGYRASKAALNMILKNFAIEFGRRYPQLVVTGLQPGTVDSALSRPFQGAAKKKTIFTPAESASMLLKTLEGLTPEESGHFFDWAGKPFLP